jgi:pyruvate-formate lyase
VCQIKALNEFKQMGKKYGFDLSRPATCAKEAIQWAYLAFLGAVKQQVWGPQCSLTSLRILPESSLHVA